ncbi:D-glucuronyl C5-epimerase family protein [Zoogloea sp.]|jgi:hypothetical protein|uniref:D-glucuronyl C5-epimerase family protein n=1 Tax=Zoogloea sp. TaxID=49181 RepID=UPI0035B2CCDB
MQLKNNKFIFFALWAVFISFLFNFFGYEIDELDAAARLFVRSGKADIRIFDEMGIPVSFNAKSKEEFVSPFYVIHYGLIYSEATQGRNERVGVHWREDSSVKYWNVSPPSVKEQYFRSAADWVVKNLTELKGQKHLVYNFDWEYRNYPNGKLKAPWWSGLSDAYAIILLLRAYDVYGDQRYFAAASDLYRSVLTPVEAGGSLLKLNGLPWIEEYVDFRAKPESMSKVLNGMVYAYYGIDAFEKHPKGFGNSGKVLRDSIIKNFKTFSMGRWSLYDSIGNAANIKYHRIHVALLSDFVVEAEVDQDLELMLNNWQVGMNNPGLFWALYADWSYAKSQFLLSWLLLLLAGCYLINRVAFKKRS